MPPKCANNALDLKGLSQNHYFIPVEFGRWILNPYSSNRQRGCSIGEYKFN